MEKYYFFVLIKKKKIIKIGSIQSFSLVAPKQYFYNLFSTDFIFMNLLVMQGEEQIVRHHMQNARFANIIVRDWIIKILVF